MFSKSPRHSLTRQIPVVNASPRRKESGESHLNLPLSTSGGALNTLGAAPSSRSNGYDTEPIISRSAQEREAAIAGLEAPDPLLDGEPTGIGALDHAMHYLKRHEAHHGSEGEAHHYQTPRSARSGRRASRPQSGESREAHKHAHGSNLPPLGAHPAPTSGAVFVPRKSRDTYPEGERAWERSTPPHAEDGKQLDDLLQATGEGKKYQRRLSISR